MTNPAMPQPVLVTGATGFIGGRLVERLLSEGCDVRALVLPSEEVPSTWDDRVTVFRGDVTDKSSVVAAMPEGGCLFHLVAVVTDWAPKELFEQVTLGGTRNVLGSAAQNSTRTVLVSSVVVYGENLGRSVCSEDQEWGRPVGMYSDSKQKQERLGIQLAAELNLDLRVVRPSNVFGPGSLLWVNEVIYQMKKGLPALVGSGEQNAGLCYVDNIVDALVRCATLPEARGRIYNIADGSPITWERYFSDLARIAGTKPPRHIPASIARFATGVCEGLWRWTHQSNRPPLTFEALNSVGSHHQVPIDRARKELGYNPDSITYETMLGKITEYWKSVSG